jgi:hypothetical protein
MTTRLPLEPCIECGNLLDAASFPMSEKVKPRPGDISMCVACGHLTAFTADMHRRALNDQEMHDIAADPNILRLQAARAKVMKVVKP